MIERAVLLSRGPTLVVPLADTTPEQVRQDQPLKSTRRRPVRSILTEVDRNQVIRALKAADGRVGGPDGAASSLGLSWTTFITRMKKLGIDSTAVSEGASTTSDTSDMSDTTHLFSSPLHATSAK